MCLKLKIQTVTLELEVLLLTAFHDLESVSVCDLLPSTGYLCLQGTTGNRV